MLSTLLGTVQALPYYRLNVSVDDDAYSSNDGDGGDRHSWKNRIQLQKQSKEQSSRDTDKLFAYGGTVSTASDQKLYHPFFLCLLFSIIYYTEESWTLDLLALPAMLNSLNAG